MQSRFDRIFEVFIEPFDLLEDEAQRERLFRLLGLSRPGLERAIADLLADVLAEVNDGLDEARVDMAFHGSAGGFVVEVKQRQTDAESSEESVEAEAAASTSDAEKLTLRLPPALKERATAAAAGAGLSLNSWIVRAIARQFDGRESRRAERVGRRDERDPQRGSKLRGWVGG